MGLVRRIRRIYWERVLRPKGEVTIRYDRDMVLWTMTRNASSRITFIKGYKDPKTFRWMDRFLKPGMTVVDVGANVGTYTLFMAKRVGLSGRFLAVEPDPTNLKYLRSNVEQNGLTQVVITPCAVGTEVGTLSFCISNVNRGTNHVAVASDASEDLVEVPVERLDDLVSRNGLTKIDLVKMDIEGFEMHALRGFEATLRDQSPILMLEHSASHMGRYGTTVDDVRNFLEGLGYAAYRRRKGSFLPYDFETSHEDAFWSKTPLA